MTGSSDAGRRTHLAIDQRWSGEVVALEPESARVRLETREEMAADAFGLVHGGFVFSAADYAAMLAVNHPHVVLASSEMTFLAPLRVGDVVEASARVVSSRDHRHTVEVAVAKTGASEPTVIARGSFACVVPAKHVLAGRRRRTERS